MEMRVIPISIFLHCFKGAIVMTLMPSDTVWREKDKDEGGSSSFDGVNTSHLLEGYRF